MKHLTLFVVEKCGKVLDDGLLLGGALLYYLLVTVSYLEESVKVATSLYSLMKSRFSGENDELLQGSF